MMKLQPQMIVNFSEDRKFRFSLLGLGPEFQITGASFVELSLPDPFAVSFSVKFEADKAEPLPVYVETGWRRLFRRQAPYPAIGCRYVLKLVLKKNSETEEIDIGVANFKTQMIADGMIFAGRVEAALQQRFSLALASTVAMLGSTGGSLPVARKIPRPSFSANLPSFNKVAAVATFVGAVILCYGLLLGNKPQTVAQNEPNDFASLQEQIRQRIRAASPKEGGESAFNSLQGQNIAVETLKQMGLDPGKANTGCLVGVK